MEAGGASVERRTSEHICGRRLETVDPGVVDGHMAGVAAVPEGEIA